MNAIHTVMLGFIAGTLFMMSIDLVHFKQSFEAVNHVYNGELQK